LERATERKENICESARERDEITRRHANSAGQKLYVEALVDTYGLSRPMYHFLGWSDSTIIRRDIYVAPRKHIWRVVRHLSRQAMHLKPIAWFEWKCGKQ